MDESDGDQLVLQPAQYHSLQFHQLWHAEYPESLVTGSAKKRGKSQNPKNAV
jgi:hypothetical protein